ncbi:hypothetical protein ADK60_40280 [Streptomyces sp. XY431]|uniref:hypothetical protein n=1 Tax=Streptomyces sp. XY431 TaxID=1415562 RepID=UPI0006B02DF5|nr:hypothetical protein [Streptomyces sp. XY431]KOV09616.1 hypothetical protein ADK60_40280 [Streptomyces sp. XY431]
MTTYQTNAVPGKLSPAAPLDPAALRQLSRHAADVLSPAGRMKDAPPLADAGAHLSIALAAFNALLTPAEDAQDIDRLADAEHALDHLHRTTNYVREHLVENVSKEEREARHRGMIDGCLEEGLTVVGAITAELVMAKGRRITVRLTTDDAYQTIQLEEPGEEPRTLRLSGRDRLELHHGLHEIGRIVWLMLRAEDGLAVPARRNGL